jgi:anti-anti-sigma regulatory factor
MPNIITIPPRLDMQATIQLHNDWQNIFPQHDSIAFECSHLQQLSASGAQLIIASQQYLKSQNKSFVMRNLSETMKRDLITLGLKEYFEFN